MCCIPSLFVHAGNTTDYHAYERQKYEYHKRCSQCNKLLDSKNHVAAHMVAYPCCLPCCGVLTLKTTCKSCNNKKNTTTKKGRSFFGGLFKHNPSLKYVCFPFCCMYNVE